jgi:hypothetical protein
MLFASILVFPARASSRSEVQSFGVMGMVRPNAAPQRNASTADASGRTSSTAARRRRLNLRYHGGPILAHSTPVAVFWDPNAAFPAGYEDTINRYFTDVANDSGGVQNVYSVAAQYFDRRSNGTIKDHVKYSVAAGTPIVDTNAYPPNDCGVSGSQVCVTRSQIQTELLTLGVTPGLDHVYFVFLPQGVETCAGGACAYQAFCAYHSGFSVGGRTYLFAVEPFNDVPVCRSGSHPNDSSADDAINTVSHEHNETNTDPTMLGWYASGLRENGDRCSWKFGPALGGSDATRYNQVINGHFYWLQMEWSNESVACRQRGR